MGTPANVTSVAEHDLRTNPTTSLPGEWRTRQRPPDSPTGRAAAHPPHAPRLIRAGAPYPHPQAAHYLPMTRAAVRVDWRAGRDIIAPGFERAAPPPA